MRIEWDLNKSRLLRANPRRGIGFEEAQIILTGTFFSDLRSDNPEQFLAVGWVDDKLFSVVFEVRTDTLGDYDWLVTLWPSTNRERQL